MTGANSFRMGLPKANRYDSSSPRFRRVGSLNGRAWMKNNNTSNYSAKVSEMRVKPKFSELKKADAAYRKMLFIMRARSGKLVKLSGSIGYKSKSSRKMLDDAKDTSIGFRSFSPFDSRFPKFFESFTPFDARFELVAAEKISKSFSPFSSSFPNYPYSKYRPSKVACRKGFQSFSPFNERFPHDSKFFMSYSPFDSRFPSSLPVVEFITYSPFDSQFPSQYTKLSTTTTYKKSESMKLKSSTVASSSSSTGSKSTSSSPSSKQSGSNNIAILPKTAAVAPAKPQQPIAESFPRFSPMARNTNKNVDATRVTNNQGGSPNNSNSGRVDNGSNASPLSNVLKKGGYNNMPNRFAM